MAPHSLAKWFLACKFFGSFDVGNSPLLLFLLFRVRLVCLCNLFSL